MRGTLSILAITALYMLQASFFGWLLDIDPAYWLPDKGPDQ